MRRLLQSILVLAVFGGVAWLAYFGIMGSFHQSNPASETSTTIVAVERKDIVYTQKCIGTLRARFEVEIKSKVGGPVKETVVSEGDHVATGAIILRIDEEDSRRELRITEASYEVSKANYALKSRKYSPDTIDTLEAELEQARTQLNLAKDRMERIRELHQKGYATESELEEAVSTFQIAESDFELAKSRLDEASLKQPDEELKLAKAELELATLSLTIARERLQDCTICSPIDADVLSLPLSPGDMVVPSIGGQEGNVVAILGDTEDFIVETSLPENLAPFVKKDDQVSITYRWAEAPFTGVVSSVNRYGERSTGAVLYPAKIEVLTPPEEVLLGTSVEVTFEMERANNALVIPVAALKGGKVIRVLANGEREEAHIETGISDGMSVQVLEGLAEGDRVIVTAGYE